MTEYFWNYIRLLLAFLIIALLIVLIRRSITATQERAVLQETCTTSLQKSAELLDAMIREKGIK